jgi:(+)-beta-caryophyllene/(+)-caryolan-1-ol synthase
VVAEQEPERPGLGQVIKVPEFDLPFASKIHPDRDSLLEQTSQWAVATGLVPDQAAAARLRRSGIMSVGPRLVPGASTGAACLTCDWTAFLFVIDDEFDDGAELGGQPELARAAIEDVIGSFRGQAPGHAARFPHMAGINAAAADLGRRFEAQPASTAWLARFRRQAEDHIWSKVTEAQHRAAGGSLDVPSYVALRRITSGAYVYSELVEMTAQAPVIERVRESSAWGRMLDAAADAWLGIQDICSCAKEVAAGDDLNLAAVMARSTRSTLQQAIDDAYQWVCRRSADFADQRAQFDGLPRYPAPDDTAETGTARYLSALDELIGGHLTWSSQDNPRYAQAKLST